MVVLYEMKLPPIMGAYDFNTTRTIIAVDFSQI